MKINRYYMNKMVIPTNESKRTVKYIDLFCCIGSFHYSFQKLGFECVMASDIYKPAKNSYQANYDFETMGDICDINPLNLEAYDVLCAGFPCQPFSQAGHHKGFEDNRGTMFSQVMRFVKQNIPKVVILENVQALLNHDSGKSFLKIKTDLESEGYAVIHKVLKCSDYGIPQMRKRLFIVACKNVEANLDAFFDLAAYEKTTTMSEYLNQNFAKEIAYTLRCGGKCSPIDDRHNWDGYWVDGKEYRLSVEDGLKLQGFVPSYTLVGSNTEKWKLLGNTIPTIFTEIIGNQLIRHTSLTNSV